MTRNTRIARIRRTVAGIATVAIGLFAAPAIAQQAASIVVASTTSTEQSGLFGHILPQFKQATGIDVKVVALGTGQALDVGRRGDADVVFVHDAAAEQKFVDEGHGIEHRQVMYNDFVLDRAQGRPRRHQGQGHHRRRCRSSPPANGNFVSRGDKSGTHAAELRYWKAAAVENKGTGYKECGCGMGPALNMAASSGAYVLADRGTWLSFKNRADLAVLVEGDKRLFNQYGVMVVNPERHPHVKQAEARKFVEWVVSPAGQEAIAAYKIEGEQLFFPNAGK